MARFGDGLAVDPDLIKAAERAARQALAQLEGRAPDVACVFVCGDDTDAVSAAAQRAAELVGARATIGCSADGVIGGARGVEAARAVSVWAGVLPGVRVRDFHLEVMRTTEGLAVIGLPEPEPDDAVAIVLADPYSFPIDGFVEQANDVLAGLPITGGLAGQVRGPATARLFLDDQVMERGAVGLMLSGPVGATTLVSQGCRPVGPSMTVTAAEGNVLMELAGRPALAKLEEILLSLPADEQALASEGLQLGIAMDEYADDYQRGDFLVRQIVGIDREAETIAIGDIVEVGRTVRFQVRDADSADSDLAELLSRLRDDGWIDTVEGALLFSCNGRGTSLFPNADHDVELVRRELATSGVGGFFAAGEIGPVGGRNHVHGFTASVLVFGSGQAADRGTRPIPSPADGSDDAG